jgi:Ca2+-dependent lipid-binding protein
LSNYSKVLSESHWASFFHQASLGNNLNCQFLSNTTLKHKAQNFADDQVDLHALFDEYLLEEVYGLCFISIFIFFVYLTFSWFICQSI